MTININIISHNRLIKIKLIKKHSKQKAD